MDPPLDGWTALFYGSTVGLNLTRIVQGKPLGKIRMRPFTRKDTRYSAAYETQNRQHFTFREVAADCISKC